MHRLLGKTALLTCVTSGLYLSASGEVPLELLEVLSLRVEENVKHIEMCLFVLAEKP